MLFQLCFWQGQCDKCLQASEPGVIDPGYRRFYTGGLQPSVCAGIAKDAHLKYIFQGPTPESDLVHLEWGPEI